MQGENGMSNTKAWRKWSVWGVLGGSRDLSNGKWVGMWGAALTYSMLLFSLHVDYCSDLQTHLFASRITQFSSVHSLSPVQLFATAKSELQHARSPCLSPTLRVHPNSCPLSRWCHPTISSSVVPFSSCRQPSIRVFSNESALRIRWPKYLSFSFSISPSNEHPGLISFRMDWLDLLAVQGTLKSLVQHHSSKA